MRIRWTVPAADDLERIKIYLEEHYPQFAEPTVRTIYQRNRTQPWQTRPPWHYKRTAAYATSLRCGLFSES
jgi:hypothetical protein